MRITLVNMPWASVDVPSLALGILKTSTRQTFPDAEIKVLDANLEFMDWAHAKTDLHYRDYLYYSLQTYFDGYGDWVFSSALYGDVAWRTDEFVEAFSGDMERRNYETTLALHTIAPDYVRHIAGKICEDSPDLVGFTSTFQQNVASLAVAEAVKKLAPGALTVLGGANCDGPQGSALHRNFPQLDFVVRGEGERAFPELISRIRDGATPHDIDGLCWRDESGASVANEMNARPLLPSEIASPDYDGYFERLSSSVARRWVEPKLVVEGARGCWWGEKHHCTFCGLNGSFMEFRSKSPGAYFDEIMHLVSRHKVLDIYAVDNILDMRYLESVLPDIIASGCDLRVQYEIKSNMRKGQLERLRDAGIVSVQPGVESLSSPVLKLMDKGVTGFHNVRLLRDAETVGLTVAWNYLFGFPGETDEDYTGIIDQMPALHHLYPPDGASRIALERFSPFFNRPELGFPERRPHRQYGLIYDLPESELTDLAYLFEAPPQGIGPDTEKRLRAAIQEWRTAYAESRLSCTDYGSRILLDSSRAAYSWQYACFEDDVELALFRFLGQPRKRVGLAGRLAASGDPSVPAASGARIEEILHSWRDMGLLFEESGHVIHIVPEERNQEIMRIGGSSVP